MYHDAIISTERNKVSRETRQEVPPRDGCPRAADRTTDDTINAAAREQNARSQLDMIRDKLRYQIYDNLQHQIHDNL